MINVLEQWGSEFSQAQVEQLVDGVWRVRLADKIYILKRRSTRTRVLDEYDLLKWLNEGGQPISLLLYTSAGVPWAEFDGAFYVLYPYVAGVSMDRLDMLAEPYAYQAGATLARLHAKLADYKASEAFPGFDLFHEVAKYAWPEVQSYSSQFRDRLYHLERAISRQLVNPYEALPRQLIHRDFHPGNLIFVQDQLVGILDFDRVRVGIRVFDLCYLSTAVLSEVFASPKQRERWLDFVQDLIRGYQTVQPLEKTEGYVFLYINYLIQLLFISYHLDAGDNDLADLNLAMLFWIYDQHDALQPLIESTVNS